MNVRALLGLLLVALALRPQLAAIGPLATAIRDDLGTSHAFLGLLTAIPVLCMGLFAPIGPVFARRLGARRAITASVVALVGCAIVRTIVPGSIGLLVLTIGIGIGIGIGGPVLSMFVRERLPDRLVGGTAAYAGGTLLGATLATAVAVPLAGATGGWRGGLLVLSIASLGSVLAWIVLTRRRSHPTMTSSAPATSTEPARGHPRRSRPTGLPLRRPVVWAIGLLFGLQSWLYYGTTAWLASVYIERGRTPSDAAVLVAVVSLAGLGAILIAPTATRLVRSRRRLLAAAASGSSIGLLGIAAVPEPALLWALVLGLGLGLAFTLILTLPTEISDDPAEVGAAAAMVLLVGYLLAALGPTVLGIVRDATGNFAAAIWLLVLIGLLMVPLAWSLTTARLRPA